VRSGWDLALLVYVVGVAWGLFKIDAGPAARVGLALAWPLGPAAFIVIVTMLLAAAAIAFPAFGAVLLAAGIAAWALLG
jgi:hypothetical protein